MSRYRKYTREVLEEAALNSKCLADVLRYLGIRSYSGGMSNHLRDRLAFFKIDTSHFLGRSALLKGKAKPWSQVLVYNDKYREHGSRLRRALIASGVPYVCSKCHLFPVWEGEELTLEVDHIDGNWANNVRENLRFLCPNCHSQMATSSNRKYVVTQCLHCGSDFQTKVGEDGSTLAHYCKPSCRTKGRARERTRKGRWPSPGDLKELVWSMPAQRAGILIGVSGSAVKRMCKRLSIATPPCGYWAKMRGNSPGGEHSPTNC